MIGATFRGLTIGGETAYPFVDGYPPQWLGGADVRRDDVDLPRRDGVVSGHNHLGARTLVLTGQIHGTSPADAQAKADALAAAWAAGPDVEELTLPDVTGAPQTFFGNPGNPGVEIVPDRAFVGNFLMHYRATFSATDPVRYGAEMNQVIGLAANNLPQTLPFVLGYHDSEVFNNAGTASVDRWTVEFEAVGGSLIDPSIAHVGSGALIFHDLTMTVGETLLVDGQERRALLNGVTPVVPTIAQWWKIAPGSNEVRFAADVSSSLTSTATLTWRPGWV